MPKNKNVAADWPTTEPYPLERLRELVITMTMPEKNMLKRHIRSHSATNHESKYIQLFNCVNDCLLELERQKTKAMGIGQQQMEEGFYPKFIARYQLRKIGSVLELKPMANYLYERILDALRYQNTENNLRLDLYARLLDIQLLQRKGLVRECLAMIRIAKELAHQLEASAQLIELSHMETRLLFKSASNQLAEQLRQLYVQEHLQVERLTRLTHLRDLLHELFGVLLSKGRVEQSPVILAKFNYFVRYTKEGCNPETFEEEIVVQAIMYYLVWIDQKTPSDFLRQFLNTRPPSSLFDHVKAILDLYDRYPDRKRDDPHRYHDNLFNYLIVGLLQKADFQIAAYASELKKIPPADPDFLTHVVYIQLIYFVLQKDFLGAKEMLESNSIWQLLERSKSNFPVSRWQIIHYHAGMIYFVRGELKEAIRWFAANLQNIPPDLSNADACTASALYLALARFEIGFTSSTAYRTLLPPLREYFPHQKNDDSFEYHLINTLSAVFQVGKDADLLEEIATKALPIIKEKIQQKKDTSHYGLLLSWLDSKKRRKPLRSVLDYYEKL